MGDATGAACTGCGAGLPQRARFCPECGAPAAPVREDRRVVTLLFTDVAGSTGLGERLDDEALRALMGRYFETARAAVERHGGAVEKFVGDAVLAVFGVPEVREDDALRAVRAAAELMADLTTLADELAERVGVRLEVRCGVNTGPVVVGSARAGGSFATGDAVNTAARLEQAAGPGEVLLGATTYELVRDAVEVDDAEPVAARGKSEPITAYRLRAVRAELPGRIRRLDAPLVGREAERAELTGLLDRAFGERRGAAVTVLGVAGMGKTRLIADLVDRARERVPTLRLGTTRCAAYGEGAGLLPVVGLLRSLLALAGNEDPGRTRSTLREAVGGDPQGTAAAELLAPLLGAGGTPGGHDETLWAVTTLVHRVARRGPLLLVVDDLHWAAGTVLELVTRLRHEIADEPVLLIGAARPDLVETDPDWLPGAPRVDVSAFDGTAVADQATAVLGQPLAPAAAAEIARRAGGNPLFAEEILGRLRDLGRLRLGDEGWEVVGDLAESDVPATVSALLAARLGALPSAERDLLERLSVAGLESDPDDVVVLAEGVEDVDALLAALRSRDLLHRPDPDGAWSFRHVLIRDAAYDAMPKARRAQLHERFADAPSSGRGTGVREAFVAHHLEQVVRLRRELAPHDPDLPGLERRTASALAEAAAIASSREELQAARRLLERAIALPTLANDQRRDLIVRLVEALGDLWLVVDVPPALDRYAECLDDTATDLERAFLLAERLTTQANAAAPIDPDELEAASRRLLHLAAAAGDTRLEMRARHQLITPVALRAVWAPVLEHLDAIEATAPPQQARAARFFRGLVLLHGPFPLQVLLDHVESGLADPTLTPPARGMLLLEKALVLAATGHDGPATAVLAEAERELAGTDQGDMHLSDMVRTEIAALSDDRAVLVTGLERLVDRARAEDDLSHVCTYVAWWALTLLEQGGDAARAAELLDEAEPATSPYDAATVAIIRAGRAILAARAGQGEAARALVEQALAAGEGTDAIWQRADVCRWLAEVPRLLGDEAGERALLEEARSLYAVKEMAVLKGLVEHRLAQLDEPGRSISAARTPRRRS